MFPSWPVGYLSLLPSHLIWITPVVWSLMSLWQQSWHRFHRSPKMTFAVDGTKLLAEQVPTSRLWSSQWSKIAVEDLWSHAASLSYPSSPCSSLCCPSQGFSLSRLSWSLEPTASSTKELAKGKWHLPFGKKTSKNPRLQHVQTQKILQKIQLSTVSRGRPSQCPVPSLPVLPTRLLFWGRPHESEEVLAQMAWNEQWNLRIF